MVVPNTSSTITDCACVIHGQTYDWIYVERLYNMLRRGLRDRFRLHVYTEADRPVPPNMIKHELEEWAGIAGPKKSWWYKMQLFNPKHHTGDMLYFDLDTIIVRDIAWILKLPTNKLWAVRDFRYLQNPQSMNVNSSVMWYNVERMAWLWQRFTAGDPQELIRHYPDGDQQYIGRQLGFDGVRFFDTDRIQSWRWQALDGGYNFAKRRHYEPGAGTRLDNQVAVLVFHGQPKPHQIQDDVVITQHWC